MVKEQPEEFIRLQQLFKEIMNGINDDYVKDELDLIFTYPLKTGAWAWYPIVKKLPSKKVDRLGDMYSGPAFCCDGYDWPVLNGVPMRHILQIDLKRSSNIGNIDLGIGLLQVFGENWDNGFMVRVIPNELLSMKNALPLPDYSDDAGHRILDYRKVSQITGYKPKRFTTLLEGFTIKGCFKNYPLTAAEIRKLTEDKLLADKIQEFDKIIKSNRKNWDLSGCHLFGTFYGIEFAFEQTAIPLFCLDRSYGVEWSDSGTALLSYNRNQNGVLAFNFDLSCH